jgi:hypothetical protein
LFDALSWELEEAVEYIEKSENRFLWTDEAGSGIRHLAFQMNINDPAEFPWPLIGVPLEAATRAAHLYRTEQPKGVT